MLLQRSHRQVSHSSLREKQSPKYHTVQHALKLKSKKNCTLVAAVPEQLLKACEISQKSREG